MTLKGCQYIFVKITKKGAGFDRRRTFAHHKAASRVQFSIKKHLSLKRDTSQLAGEDQTAETRRNGSAETAAGPAGCRRRKVPGRSRCVRGWSGAAKGAFSWKNLLNWAEKAGKTQYTSAKKAIARRQKKPTDFKTQPNCKKCYNFLMKKGGFPLTDLL